MKTARHAAIAAACGGAAVGLCRLAQQQKHRGNRQIAPAGQRRHLKPVVSWLAVDALSGAVGEVASLVVLYPLDSLKVLCQARGTNTGAVLAELRALGCNTRAARQLYAGCGSAALCSAAIGAIYLLAFYSAKRLGTAALAAQQRRQQQQGRFQPRVAGVAGGAGSEGQAVASEGTHPLVASLAGVAASLAGSVFEAPMEMFKLRTQAGALQGPMLGSMMREFSSHGLASLYTTYGAFMLKSIPYDVAELATYSQMCDWRAAAAARAAAADASGRQRPAASTWRESVGGMLAAVPDGTGDMLIGAVAGVASVLVSMPCDVIKTHMDLFPPVCASARGGVLSSTRAFFETGRRLVALGGPQALFVGVAPRLLQNVPSCMVYWAAVEATRRFMVHHFDVQGNRTDGAASTSTSRFDQDATTSTAPGSLVSSSSSISTSTSSAGSSSLFDDCSGASTGTGSTPPAPPAAAATPHPLPVFSMA
ncbi:hypothetical protein D9Q98_010529 [Chlorella vulgaris]|uniref:Mitochondrial carrier protein n=1 Tax=Chlorella vulgaris TaxID=3077 RepID=A0A9D4TQD8_CHLVU|nr:hypothetical protein D9Q98_010529 [Chlorella vulgaris]